ncbi:MAG TPA: biosynthetic-type acetolactate synthase large subunit [Syntrophales bacterium]|nr:biosynthetic-type acetolactate synthase large subunit [Syntrophales bacterium]HOS76429.1 biosynthetic-type acetolactate synthase large subunit [Syntrophales bacterium]
MSPLIGADILLDSLRQEKVEAIFGYPGANTLPVHDRIQATAIRHYLMRHEQAAAHAADGYARASGKVGVCLATSGPGATNLVTGIATAFMDSIPLVALTAQVNTNLLGRDAFQETDIIGITLPITKHSFQVLDVRHMADTLREAFDLARGGRPGPVLVDLPRDILAAPAGGDAAPSRPETRPAPTAPDASSLEELARLLNRSERPVILIGGGAKLSGACGELEALVAKARIPFATTMMGLGAVASGNGYNLGFIGTHGHELANRIIHQADFILAVGARFSDRSTSKTEEFAPLATIAQIDIDPTSIGKNLKADCHILGDIRDVLRGLLPRVERREASGWMERIEAERAVLREGRKGSGDGPAGAFIRQVQCALPPQAIAVADVGLNQIWTLRNWQPRTPRSILTSGGMGTMGFSIPAAVGAQIARPDHAVVAITGDGGCYMNIQELATIGYYRLPVKIIVINNGHLGMIRQLQDLLFDGRLNTIALGGHVDLTAVARGFGIPSARTDMEGDTAEGLDRLRRSEGPFLLEAVIDPERYVYPLIPPGRSNMEMIYGRTA